MNASAAPTTSAGRISRIAVNGVLSPQTTLEAFLAQAERASELRAARWLGPLARPEIAGLAQGRSR